MMQKIIAKRRAHKQRQMETKKIWGYALKYFKGRQDIAEWRINIGRSRQEEELKNAKALITKLPLRQIFYI